MFEVEPFIFTPLPRFIHAHYLTGVTLPVPPFVSLLTSPLGLLSLSSHCHTSQRAFSSEPVPSGATAPYLSSIDLPPFLISLEDLSPFFLASALFTHFCFYYYIDKSHI